MKKALALALSLTLVAGLAAPVLAEEQAPAAPETVYVDENGNAVDPAELDTTPGETPDDPGQIPMLIEDLPAPEEVDVPLPAQFAGILTVDGNEVDLSAVPGAPAGYIPMRAFCDAAGAYVEWFPEENSTLFVVDGHSVNVDLTNLSVTCDFEPVEGVTAYLDPAGYTFLPLSYLTTFENIKLDDHSEMDSIRYDITTIPQRTELERLAYDMMDAADCGELMALDAAILADNYFFTLDLYDEVVAYQPIMTGQPSSIVLATVKEGQLDAAKAEFASYQAAIMNTLGFYPATAAAIEKAQIVGSPDGKHLLFVSTWESNEACVALFEAAFPARER